MTKPYFKNPQNDNEHPIEACTLYNLTNEFLEENSEEISSVALLSPACLNI